MVRIRKVKCDEGRPTCHRCISTGRICDGYGIWDGDGENLHRHRACVTGMRDKRVIPRLPASISIPFSDNTEEKEYFEWFKCRSATKLPGSFISRFWDTLLFQASLNEPAVSHAILALSSAHKGAIVNADDQTKVTSAPSEQERFALKHYVKAINHLQPCFSVKDRTSFRVTLITCIAFVCLEFLRGHFKIAQAHLQNGLQILIEAEMLSNDNIGILQSKPHQESTDDWIIEAFSRLHLQVELFKYTFQHPCLVLQVTSPQSPTLVFHSINDAWQQLGQILNRVFLLTHHARQQALSQHRSTQYPQALPELQQQIQIDLARWLDRYESFKNTIPHDSSIEEKKAYQGLPTYHTMATIMAATCLTPTNESIYDSHTSQFLLLIKQLTHLRTLASPAQILPAGDMSRSIIDMGWIPPLYYTAIKCRVHRLRVHAIRLLESTSHREGIWDAKAVACVARKVMEVEERGFYKGVADDFPLASIPLLQDLSLPVLPEEYRMRDVEIVLSGAPLDRILLFCKRKEGDGGDCRVLVAEYDVYLRRWTDKTYE